MARKLGRRKLPSVTVNAAPTHLPPLPKPGAARHVHQYTEPVYDSAVGGRRGAGRRRKDQEDGISLGATNRVYVES